MNKKYILRLADQEWTELAALIKKFNGSRHAMRPSDDNVTRRGRTCNVYRRFLVKTPGPNTARKRELTVR
jgi:hypothetical protein